MRQIALIPDTAASLTRDWLCGVLDENVTSVDVLESRETAASHCVRIAATFRDGGTRRLFVKFSKSVRRSTMLPWSERLGAMNRNEHDFHDAARRGAAPTVPFDRATGAWGRQPVARCHALGIDDDGRALLVLDDVTATHVRATADLAPCMAALARVHAAWWNSDLLGRLVARRLPERRLGSTLTTTRELSAPRRATAQWIIEHRDALFSPRGPRTLLHGDVNVGNFLFPRDASRDVPLLIDWQTCFAGTPTDDLAMVLVPRDASEAHLRRWHEELHAHGARYEWDELLADYREAVLRFLGCALFLWQVDDAIVARAFRAAEVYGVP
jgi:hypothetical protein